LGKYTEKIKSLWCEECKGAGMSTAYPGTKNSSKCGCPFSSYQKVGDKDCSDCQEGMSCESFGAAVDNWALAGGNPMATQGDVYPMVMVGYWATASQPTSLYRCTDDRYCPGGDPGSCAQDASAKVIREGVACGRCVAGYINFGSECVVCDSGFKPWRFVMLMLCSPFIVIGLYKGLNFRIETVISVKRALSHTFFVLLLYLQTLALIQDFDLEFPNFVADISVAFTFLIIDTTSLKMSCGMFDESVVVEYAMRLLIPVWILLSILVTFVLYKFLVEPTLKKCKPGSIWQKLPILEVAKMQNTYLTLLNTFYIGLTKLAASAFQCYRHPNGQRSMLASSSVLCSQEDGRWAKIMPQAVVGIVFYTVGVFCLFAYANYSAPMFFHSETFRKRWLFLLTKFRPEFWWWDQLLLLKGLALNLTTMIFVSGTSQAYWVILVSITYVWALFFIRPWRHHAANLLDMTVSFSVSGVLCLILFWSDKTRFVEELTFDYTAWMIGFAIIPFFVSGASVSFYGQRWLFARRHTSDKLVFSRGFRTVMEWVLERRSFELNALLLRCSDHDLRNLKGAHDFLISEMHKTMPSNSCTQQRLIMTRPEDGSEKPNNKITQYHQVEKALPAKAGGGASDATRKVSRAHTFNLEISDHVEFDAWDKAVEAIGIPELQDATIRKRVFQIVDHSGAGRIRKQELLGVLDYLMAAPEELLQQVEPMKNTPSCSPTARASSANGVTSQAKDESNLLI